IRVRSWLQRRSPLAGGNWRRRGMSAFAASSRHGRRTSTSVGANPLPVATTMMSIHYPLMYGAFGIWRLVARPVRYADRLSADVVEEGRRDIQRSWGENLMVNMPSRLGVVAALLRRHSQLIIAGLALLALVGVLVPLVHSNGSAVAGTGQASAASPFSPLVSRGKPVVCAKSNELVGGKNVITSGVYSQDSYWGIANNALPSWCAIHVGVGPSRLMVVWYSDYDEDQDRYISNGRMPQGYTLSVSPNSTN